MLDVYSKVIMMILIMAFAAAFDVVGIFLALHIRKRGGKSFCSPEFLTERGKGWKMSIPWLTTFSTGKQRVEF